MNPVHLLRGTARVSFAWVVVLGLAAANLAAQPAPGQVELTFAAPHAPDRVIVKYRATASASVPGASATAPSTHLAVRQALNASLITPLTRDGATELLRLPAGMSVGAAVQQLRTRADVAYAEPDYELTIQSTPDDPHFADGKLWGLHNTGQASPEGPGLDDADIDAPEGWAIRTDASEVIVAVIDTGIRRTHQDLAANMWQNTGEIPDNGIDDDGNGYIDDRHGLNAISYSANHETSGDPMDDHGHGTHTAGTIGAVGNNGVGVAGVAWRVKLMACKFLSSNGSGFTSDAVLCVDYARINGAKVMNNSWGGGLFSLALRDAIQRARDAGIVFVVAAGNDFVNSDVAQGYPAAYGIDNMVVVAASTPADFMAAFSNYGQGSVHLAAPGASIYSTHHTADDAYTYMSGTSMAAPHVAGAFALLFAQFPSDDFRVLKNRLLNSTRAVPALGNKLISGGVLNLAAALSSTDIGPVHDLRARSRTVVTSGAAANFLISDYNAGADLEPDEPAHAGQTGGASVWYRYTGERSGPARLTISGRDGFRPVLAAYTHDHAGTLVALAGGAAGAGPMSFDLPLQAGRTYLFAIDGVDGLTGAFDFEARQAPAHDAFAAAIPLAGDHGTSSAETEGATRETGETAIDGAEGGASVWYTWTAPATGDYTFTATATNPSADPYIAFFTGDALPSLSRANYRTTYRRLWYWSYGVIIMASHQSVLSATAGTSYRIQVDGYFPPTHGGLGSLRLQWDSTPPNDDFAQARGLEGLSGTSTGDTRGATRPNWLPMTIHGWGTKDVWFKWRPTLPGEVRFDTLGGTDWDTTLEVYTGSREDELTLVTSNDDVGGVLQSAVTFFAAPDRDYFVRLNGYSSASMLDTETAAGPYELRWEFQAEALPIFIEQPADRSIIAGQSVWFRVQTWAAPAAAHRWQEQVGAVWQNLDDGSGVSGARTATLQLAGSYAAVRHNARYRCIATNPAGSATSAAATLAVQAAAARDMNQDGHSDLLWRSTSTGQVAAWFMDGATFAGSASLGFVSLDWQEAGSGDFNRDGAIDLLWRSRSTGQVAVWFMDGPLFAGSASIGYVSRVWENAGTGDFDHDGHTDLLWRSGNTGEVAIWFMEGSTFRGSTSIGVVSLAWEAAGTGDFNRDGHTDLLWRNVLTGEVATWFMHGSTFGSSISIGVVSLEWETAGTGDFNHDDHTDLLWRNTRTGEVAVWFMDGALFAGSASLGHVSLEWQTPGG